MPRGKKDEEKMAELAPIVNQALTVSVGGKDLPLKKLSLAEMYASFEVKVKQQKISDANLIAQGLTGADKVEFLREVWKDLPSGDELTALVNARISSLAGVRDLLFMSVKKSLPSVTMDQIADLVNGTNIDEITPLVEYICGFSADEEEDKSPKKKGSSKKA